jgi:hypothetical protein
LTDVATRWPAARKAHVYLVRRIGTYLVRRIGTVGWRVIMFSQTI